MKNPFKKKKPSPAAIAETVKLGIGLTVLYLESCTNYLAECNQNRTDKEDPIITIPITVLELYVKTFIIADQKRAGELTTKREKQAYAKLATWKGDIVKQIYASCQAYTQRYATKEVPLHIVEGIIKLINIKIQS